jgi:predicted DNA-binding transcriptional regulator AlpA
MEKAHQLMRTPQAAAYVNLSVSTLEKLRPLGKGPPFRKVGPKIVVYDRVDLDAWIEACTQGPAANANTAAGAR